MGSGRFCHRKNLYESLTTVCRTFPVVFSREQSQLSYYKHFKPILNQILECSVSFYRCLHLLGSAVTVEEVIMRLYCVLNFVIADSELMLGR